MEPTCLNKELQRTATLLVYVLGELKKPVPPWVVTESHNEYASRKDLVPLLCTELRLMTKIQQEQIIYNARSAESRDLASWWDEHQRADREREAREQRERDDERLREQALAKLTPEEQRALLKK